MASFISETKVKVAFGTWWFSWTELHFIVLNNFGISFNISVTDAIVSNTLLAAACLLISMNMQYYNPRKEKFWYVLIISIVMSVIWLFLSKFILASVFSGNSEYLSMLNASMIIRFGMAFLISSVSKK